MLLIKFFNKTLDRKKNDHEEFSKETFWYAVNELGQMVEKPEIGLPHPNHFTGQLVLLGLVKMAPKPVEIKDAKGNVTKTVYVQSVVNGQIIQKFDELGRINRTWTVPEYGVVVESMGERACWSRGIEIIKYEDDEWQMTSGL